MPSVMADLLSVTRLSLPYALIYWPAHTQRHTHRYTYTQHTHIYALTHTHTGRERERGTSLAPVPFDVSLVFFNSFQLCSSSSSLFPCPPPSPTTALSSLLFLAFFHSFFFWHQIHLAIFLISKQRLCFILLQFMFYLLFAQSAQNACRQHSLSPFPLHPSSPLSRSLSS